jgi:hypothetical protein
MPRSIQKEFPHIFIDWHPTLNGKVNPSSLRRTSKKKYWWRCHNKKCGCNWQATIYARIRLGDICPKCKERKKKKFTKDLLEIKKIFSKIKQLQLQVDKCLVNFIDDDSSKISKQRDSVTIRRKIDEINNLGIEFRKIILNYKKKMIGYNIEKKLKNNKNE